MKILILANLDIGLYKFRKELIIELINKGNEVYIALPQGDLIKSLKKLGCKYINIDVDRRGINPLTDIQLIRKYSYVIKKIQPDMVITYTIKPNIYGGIACRLNKTNYAVNITGLGTAFQKSGIIKFLVINMYKIALKKAKVVFFENSGNRDEFVKYHICSKNKMHVLNGAGVNTEEYPYIEYPHNSIFKFLFIGRVMKEKGIDELLSAMKMLINEGKKVFLDVVGPCEEQYEDILSQCEKEGWLKYHGYQEDVKPFIAACDCFVLPSYHEGMANTNLECASSGRPIITSNIPGCKEAVVYGSGFLCKVKDVDSSYRAMKNVLCLGTEQRKKMGIKGHILMKQKFEKKKVVADTINYLEVDI